MMANIWTNLSLFMPMETSLLNSMEESFDSAGNEHNERQLFGEDLEEGWSKQFAAIEGL